MATKPDITLARFADTGGATVTNPPSGLRDSGFVDNTPIEEGFVNALFLQDYRWHQYLSDGALSGDHTIAGTLGVTGLVTTSGGITVPTGQAVALNGTTTLSVGTGAVTFGGLVNANAGIAVPTGQAVALSGSTTLNVGGNATVGGTLNVTGTVNANGAATTVGGALTTAGALTVGGQSLSFTDFTFTANSGTNQITATANLLQTGDGPVRASNSGGGLPGGLAAGTDYYWIRLDADHGKLATSRVNSIIGLEIDITSNGTGTQTLLHQAGTTRISDATVTRSLTVNGFLTLGPGINGPVSIFGTIVPTAITSTAQINDWAPAGFAGAWTIQQVVQNAGAGGNVSISGIAGPLITPSDGRIVVLHALGVQAADTITLLHNSSSSAFGNRFALAGGNNLVLPQNGAVVLQYDGGNACWRAISKNF